MTFVGGGSGAPGAWRGDGVCECEVRSRSLKERFQPVGSVDMAS